MALAQAIKTLDQETPKIMPANSVVAMPHCTLLVAELKPVR